MVDAEWGDYKGISLDVLLNQTCEHISSAVCCRSDPQLWSRVKRLSCCRLDFHDIHVPQRMNPRHRQLVIVVCDRFLFEQMI